MRCPKCNYNNPPNLKTFESEGKNYCLCQKCGYFIAISQQSTENASSIKTTFKLVFIWMTLSYLLGGLKFILIPVLFIVLYDTIFNDLPLIFLRIGIVLYIAIIIIQRLMSNQINQIK